MGRVLLYRRHERAAWWLGGTAAVGQQLVAEHAWQSGDAGDLQFAVGAQIEITSLDPGSGWVTGKLADGTTGIFPSNYARAAGPADSPVHTRARAATAPEAERVSTAGRQRSESVHPGLGGASPPVQYVAAHTFDPQGQACCIALAAGEAVVVTDSSRDDWWQGYRVTEPAKLGSFPKAYVKRAETAAETAGIAARVEAGAAEATIRRVDDEAAAQKAAADATKRADQEAEAERIKQAEAQENARVASEQEVAARAKAKADAAATREKAEAEAAAGAAALKHELELLADVAQHAKELLEKGTQPTAHSAILAAVKTKLGSAAIEEAVPPAQAPSIQSLPKPEPEPAGCGPPPPSPATGDAINSEGEDSTTMAEAARAAERAALRAECRGGVAP